MHTRVKIEWDEGPGNYAYVTTEHADSSYGQPVLAIKGVAHGPADIKLRGGVIVTSDKELAKTMERLGFDVRISNPQALYVRRKRAEGERKTYRVELTGSEVEEFKAMCEARQMTPHAILRELISIELKKFKMKH